jgi:hypothetical protein
MLQKIKTLSNRISGNIILYYYDANLDTVKNVYKNRLLIQERLFQHKLFNKFRILSDAQE